jgi:hypothetical protein
LSSVFEYVHRNEIKRAKDEGVMSANQLETIVHPNEYFKRSYLLKNLNSAGDSSGSNPVAVAAPSQEEVLAAAGTEAGGGDVKMEEGS